MNQQQLGAFFPRMPTVGPPAETEVTKVGVLGGGTAGYMTALALTQQIPSLDVTVIESSKIPVIGVGEATTPLLPKLLHFFLGLDIHEFYAEVQPTWKLGIKFEWGAPGDSYFNFPFDLGLLLESLLYTGDVNSATLESRLMSAEKVPLFKMDDGTYAPAFHWVPYAYHLENRRFVGFLNKQLKKRGVQILDRVIVDAKPTADGESVDHLVTDADEVLRYDLYVDCSGFRSMLIEKTVNSKFVSFASSLFADSAMVAKTDNGGHIKPYTRASTLPNGWCWNTPHVEEDRLGYVFSSEFCDEEQAEKEMRELYPGIGETNMIKFRSGRHEHFWKGNCVAIGNSYGFVEPLESTALHMIAEQINWLVSCFPRTKDEIGTRKYLNRRVNGEWDMLRAFLAIHYKFNQKLDTPYWRHCREDTDIELAQDFIQLYRERAPVSYCPREVRPFDDHLNNQFGRYGWDNMLMGLGVEGGWVEPSMSKDEWELRHKTGEHLLGKAMLQADALKVLHEQPELLTMFVEDSSSWLGREFPTILKPYAQRPGRPAATG